MYVHYRAEVFGYFRIIEKFVSSTLSTRPSNIDLASYFVSGHHIAFINTDKELHLTSISVNEKAVTEISRKLFLRRSLSWSTSTVRKLLDPLDTWYNNSTYDPEVCKISTLC